MQTISSFLKNKTVKESILNKQSSPKTKNASSKHYEKLNGLNRAGPERLEASLKLNRINKFGYYNKETKEFVYTNTIKQERDELFQTYCSRVRKEKIVLSRAPDKNPVFAQDIVINYQTRFTSPARQKQNLDGFRAAYKKASRRHVKGVFLTLTSNPKGGSLWQINKKPKQLGKNSQSFLADACRSVPNGSK